MRFDSRFLVSAVISLGMALMVFAGIVLHFSNEEKTAKENAEAFCQATYIGESAHDLSVRADASDFDKRHSHFYLSKTKYLPDSYTITFSGAALSRHICFVELEGNKVVRFSTKDLD